ncbi:thiolase family protein [Dactylosporangium roseum]|uniref:Thiolase family protein n=1 Tax=Dactylosporangium roseum TaxID=47989 RepID=A0ABY5YYF1_9ACTN|nr:thiolase family protein [Dactylosporangium roseum]UWZ34429.1 thiolase family protein [Dactylosporangium roseum]
MTGLRGDAAIVGFTELRPERRSTLTPRPTIEQWALLSRAALDDAGIAPTDVNGLVATHVAESARFVPATLAEYLGIEVDFAEFVDLGGATSAGMIWRAAAAIEMGLADVVLCTVPAGPVAESPHRPAHDIRRYGASSELFGSPQAEFEIPYGNIAQNAPYAMIANRYAAEFGYDAQALAKIAVDQRFNACANPDAVFHGKPITVDDVLASPMVCDPIHMLETVMRCFGGASVVVASREVARRANHRPVWVVGCGERLEFKTPTYARDLLRTPIAAAADRAFAMAGVARSDIDMVSLYDCYTITALLTIEDAGFCKKGAGAQFVREHDLTYRGDFPCNTQGGQLSFGQSGMAGGMSHVCDAARQIMGRAGEAQVPGCDTAFVTGNGGIMSEQVALILRGE